MRGATVLLLLLSVGCEERELRGTTPRSADGQTRFAIEVPCDAPALDQRPWTQPAGVAATVTPGLHTLSCSGSDIAFSIPAGTTFHFDYLGP